MWLLKESWAEDAAFASVSGTSVCLQASPLMTIAGFLEYGEARFRVLVGT